MFIQDVSDDVDVLAGERGSVRQGIDLVEELILVLI